MLAAYVALLGLWPISHVFSLPPSPMWSRIVTMPGKTWRREALVLIPSAGACLGAALGAFTQALDWGRMWQAWPLPSLYGSAIGLVAGNAIAFITYIAT